MSSPSAHKLKTPSFVYFLQAIVAWLLFGFMWVLPPRAASAAGGWLGRQLGRVHRGSRIAHKNLQLVMPGRVAEHDAIVTGMWDNLGRVLGEYPHLLRLWRDGNVELAGRGNVPEETQKIVFVAAHLANWELGPLVAARSGWPMASIYRPLNNKYLNPLLQRMRKFSQQDLFSKSAEGAMGLMRHVRKGNAAGLLTDQRLGDGISVPFFGQPAMTAPIPALLAVKYGAIIIPVQVERLREKGGVQFRVTLHRPMAVPVEGDEATRILQLTASINAVFEEWIRARPADWLWMHDRWRIGPRQQR